eukprot:scaffold7372_cov123-Isochrysis_galbana.AAC.3
MGGSKRSELLQADAIKRRERLAKQQEGPPLRHRQPFDKQTTRSTAVHGKLLEDLQMTRVLLGQNMLNDVAYVVSDKALSSNKNFGWCQEFSQQRGRVPINKQGTRSAAEGTYESHWVAQAPPNINLTRPGRPSTGVPFSKQITRLQDVNGKLLEDIAMTRTLFAAGASGPEYYARAHDSMEHPVYTSSRQRVGIGIRSFASMSGRLPMHKSGSRASAGGSATSHWEPGAGFTQVMHNRGGALGFDKQSGRVSLHLSGLRGAPPNPDFFNFSGATRPQTAMALIRGQAADAPKKQSRAHVIHEAPHAGNLPKRHVAVANFDKGLSREQWTTQVMRT